MIEKERNFALPSPLVAEHNGGRGGPWPPQKF